MRAALIGASLAAVGCGGASGEPVTSSDTTEKKTEDLVPHSNILVTYYSRSGTTKALAEAIAKDAGADLVPIVDTVDRRGVRGFVRSIVDAAKRRDSKIERFPADVGAYDVVAVGTPDWGKSMSSPVRFFLEQNHGRFRSVAFFLTDGTADHVLVFKDMADLAGAQPIATLGIPHDEVVENQHGERAAQFAKALLARARQASSASVEATSP